MQQATVEKWLPIHAACINGHHNVVEALLKFQYPSHIFTKFRLVNLMTCFFVSLSMSALFWRIFSENNVAHFFIIYIIKGDHLSIVPCSLKKLKSLSFFREGDWEYELPFDVNYQDVTGQTPIYLSCLLGNSRMLDSMLKFKVKASRTKASQCYLFN